DSSASSSCTVVAPQPDRALGTIASGPVQGGGKTWWQVNFDTAPSGWTPDSTLTAAPTVNIPVNTWTIVNPTFTGAPNGGQIFPMGWANKGAYDPVSHRVIDYDRWYDSVRGNSIWANGLYAYDPLTNVFTVLKL